MAFDADLVLFLALFSAATATWMRGFILGCVHAENSLRECFVRDGLPRTVDAYAHLPIALVIAVIVVIVVVVTGEIHDNVYAPLRIILDLAPVMLTAIPVCRGMGRGGMSATVTGANNDRRVRVAVPARREQRYCAGHKERQQEQELSFHSQCLM